LNPYIFHINPYDLAFLGVIFTGLNFALLLGFTKRINQAANRFLALALVVMVLWMICISAINIRLQLQFSLALGPLIYFYVLKLTRPQYKFKRKDLLHFILVLLEQVTLLNPVLPFLAFISVVAYLYYSHSLIERFYRRLKFTGGDRYRYELQWLHKLLAGFGLLWLLWIPYAAVGYFYYHHQLSGQVEYPFYLCVSVMLIWIAAAAYLKPEVSVQPGTAPVLKPLLPTELKQKSIWLKKVVKENRYYEDPELSLVSLAEKLELTTHELSRIINIALKKNFNDFINEYRVAEVARKMQNSTFDHITLLGIAFESGFNSKTTFNRTFRQITGTSPAEYKTHLKKERPSYNLGRNTRFAPVISHHKINRNFMIKNYLKIAWRNALRHKGIAFINIAGLSIGMAGAVLILLWIQNEVSFDKFHKNKDNLYEVYGLSSADGKVSPIPYTSQPLGPALKQNYPDVEAVSRFAETDGFLFTVGDKHMTGVDGSFVDPAFLQMFTLPLVEGLAGNQLTNIKSIVITQKLAKKLFGNGDALNKTIKIDSTDIFTVSGVLKDIPANSRFTFDYLLPWPYLKKVGGNNDSWESNNVKTFVQLKTGTNAAAFDLKIKDITRQHSSHKDIWTHFVFPLSKWHLYADFENGKPTGGRIETVRLFGIIAAFILLIACINFMNLSTARSEKRAKEVGVRKVAGAGKSLLILQFLMESFITALISGIASLVIVQLALAAFNTVIDAQVSVPYSNISFWLAAVGFIVFTSLLAGSYPAFYLSSFKPVSILKGKFIQARGGLSLRKVLVVIQFTFAVILIISTIVVQNQIKYAQNRDKGFSQNNLIYVNFSGDIEKNYPLIKSDLLNAGIASSVTKSMSNITQRGSNTWGLKWPGAPVNSSDITIALFSADADLVKTTGLTLTEGRDIDIYKYPGDSTAALLNETAVETMGLKSPLGQIITQPGDKTPIKWRVVGVVKDYLLGSPYEKVPPLVIQGPKSWFSTMQVKFNPARPTAENLAAAENIFKKYNPAYPFDYKFVDEEFAKHFDNEQRTKTLAGLFATLAIFISCLGLFGLSAYVAESRVKEIGIRKVLGASEISIAKLLSVDFIKLVVISIVIATPIAWYGMNRWLQSYTYRISLSWQIFVIAGLLAVVIALVTVSWQSIKAALAKPVKSLRSE
jgi:putative ABC transport system permease protein